MALGDFYRFPVIFALATPETDEGDKTVREGLRVEVAAATVRPPDAAPKPHNHTPPPTVGLLTPTMSAARPESESESEHH